MSVKFRNRDRLYGGLTAVCAAVLPVAAHAQDAANDRIEAIERQMRTLQKEHEREMRTFQSDLQRLKSELGEAKQQLRQSRIEAQRDREEAHQAREAADQARQDAATAAAAQAQATRAAAQAQAAAATLPPAVAAAPPAGPGFGGFEVGMPLGRPTIASADGRMSFAIGGLWQLDMGGYFQNPYPNTQFPKLPSTAVNLRRGRLYFVAKYDDWRVNVTPDFGDNPDGNPTLYEANINYTGIKPLTFTVGYTHPFVSLEDATFPGNLLFLERPSIVFIERSVAAGIQRASLGGYAATGDYFASAYLTGPTFGAQRDTLLNNEQLAFVSRVAVRPYHDQDWNLHAEASGQHVFHPNLNTSGVPGVSQQTISLADEPELRLAFDPLVDTGPISASSASVYGGGVGANWRNFLMQGEFYQIAVIQSKLPHVPAPMLGFNGGYVEGSVVLTGEAHPYNIDKAAWGRPHSDHPFSLAEGGIGAWEVAARYSTVDLNSDVVPGAPQSVTGGVYGGKQQIGAAALSWYPNDWLRFILQFQYVDVNKLNSAGTTQIGQKFETLALRAEAAW
jgi:phosphate-selective porin OprO/OprP